AAAERVPGLLALVTRVDARLDEDARAASGEWSESSIFREKARPARMPPTRRAEAFTARRSRCSSDGRLALAERKSRRHWTTRSQLTRFYAPRAVASKFVAWQGHA